MEFRRFKCITKNQNKLEAFSKLYKCKNLTRKDLLLILSCIEINENI